MFSQIKAFIIAWSFFYFHVVYAYPPTTTISPVLNLLNHHVYYYNNPFLNHYLSSPTIPLNLISPAVNSLHLSHEQLTQHFNHLHEQYLNNLFGSSDFSHHPFHHYPTTAMIMTSTQSPPLLITSTTTTRSPSIMAVSLSKEDKDINKKFKEKNELIKINKLNQNISPSKLNLDELLKNSKLDEKEKEDFLKHFQTIIEKELEKRQKKKLIIKTTGSEIKNDSGNFNETIKTTTTTTTTTILTPPLNEIIKAQGTRIIKNNENNVDSKELLENLDLVSKAIEQYLNVEKERSINTAEKSLPVNEEEIENISKKEDDDEDNFKINEQKEFDRFINSKKEDKISTSTTSTTTTTTTASEIFLENTSTPPIFNVLRRRLPPTRYNTEFERLAQDYQERLMMAAGGIEEDVFKILRNAKIALYSQ
ncbi:Hypothetical protein SRAE_2000059900 [Strongyloides ratti]|uniref:Uncharacterized protein n=1 Tax=Strongyloides ratti TaxID=34506 RepID=A0A090LEH9_STRRB|nr:Hypothetical protein SRAE_2000059900 [Strongyloides ratti]CEF65925.1 Hypothetical protein SRAE_2000059900 [Strongyloides ratti]